MMLHPEAVKKAQAEIDQIIGDGQLPSLEDRPNLPYIDCILKEILRYVGSKSRDFSTHRILGCRINPPLPVG